MHEFDNDILRYIKLFCIPWLTNCRDVSSDVRGSGYGRSRATQIARDISITCFRQSLNLMNVSGESAIARVR
eukprot:4169917-Alexandrium_andersonii.AAC.1